MYAVIRSGSNSTRAPATREVETLPGKVAGRSPLKTCWPWYDEKQLFDRTNRREGESRWKNHRAGAASEVTVLKFKTCGQYKISGVTGKTYGVQVSGIEL